jgi:cell division septum initiation protein DivIVA
MNNKQQAAHDLRRLSQMLKGVIAIGDDLEALGSIEQAVAEAQSRIIKLQGEESELKQRLVEMDTALQGATLSVESQKRQADERAAETAAKATREARAIIQEAAGQAANIVSLAKQTGEDIDIALRDKRALLHQLNLDIGAAQSRLDEVNAKLSELRKRL